MEILLRNQFNKGDTLPIIVSNERVTLISPKSGNTLDITNLIGEELEYLLKVGRAVAVVKDKETMNISYCFNYHTHTQYSILDGMSRLQDIAKKSSGISAITDHGNNFAVLKWQKAMEKVGKKPVFGFEAYMEDVLTGEKTGSHGLFLVKNEAGLKNMFYLCSIAYENFYKKAHVPLNELKEHSEGLIFTSACIGGELASVIVDDYEGAKKVATFYKDIFGEDYYIEIQRHHFAKEEEANPLLIKLAKELNIKIVGANDSHYMNSDDKEEHKKLLALSYGKTVEEVDGFDGDGYHYMTDKEMVENFSDLPEAISNTIEMALKCDCRLKTGEYHMPVFPIPEEYKDDNEYLLYLIDKGFKERFGNTPLENSKEYIDRLEYEKSVIISMGFSSYFLIVWDFIKWAKDHGILVGPGRGSGAGSLCLYCLNITDLDPILYALKFERFLNPDRISMPDIDVDFEDERRGEVIEYVKEKYGADNVCNIITFGTLQAKVAIKDICRVSGESVAFASDICKMLNPKASTLKGSLEGEDASPELLETMNSNPKVKQVIDSVLKITGGPRQTSTHACGIVISDQPIRNYIPTALVKDSKSDDKNAKALASQVTMTEVEELGLLKADFLGLKTMSVIGKTIKVANIIRNHQGLNPINYYREIPLNDPYVYEEIAKGQSYAVFQIESEGMRSFMRELFADVGEKIRRIEEEYSFSGFSDFITGNGTDRNGYINAMTKLGNELFERMIAGVSLYRPGPMDYIPDYINNMNNPNYIEYDHPLLEPILKTTYGVIVYQEQVMDIVKSLAGFTAGQSDTIRKAMSKKKQEILDEYKPYFIYGSKDAMDDHTGKPLNIKGCISNGVPEETAVAIWDKMADFAKYAFNKSHAGAYAVLTVSCAWLKHYYLAPYMSATLNVYSDNNDKLKGYISNTKAMGINILPPDVNLSNDRFMTNGRDILFGLKGLKGINKVTKAIIEERKNGEYTSVLDFVRRTYPLKVTKKAYESLVLSGCFDRFGYTRKSLIEATENVMKIGKKVSDKLKKLEKKEENPLSFLETLNTSSVYDVEIKNVEEYTEREKLGYELDVASIYISAHPLDSYNKKITEIGVTELSHIKTEEEGVIEEGQFTFAGTLSNVRTFLTKKKDKMATFTLSDRTDSIKCTVFPRDFETANIYLENPKSLVIIKGTTKNDENYGPQLIVNTIIDIDQIPDLNTSRVFVKLSDMYPEIDTLTRFAKAYTGAVPLIIQSQGELFELKERVNPTSGLFMALSGKYGYENVIFKQGNVGQD